MPQILDRNVDFLGYWAAAGEDVDVLVSEKKITQDEADAVIGYGYITEEAPATEEDSAGEEVVETETDEAEVPDEA